ncbi:MAG: PKD domain-containing protein, partial [Acidobacteriota bacterium]
GPGGTSTETKTNYINVTPAAVFKTAMTSITSGELPLVVDFVNMSKGKITSRSWDFGDGTTSTAVNPTHTYRQEGSFTVSLTVTGPGGSNTKSATLISAVARPDFSARLTGTSDPLSVQFTDTSLGSISARSWNFGDGSTSTSANPQHVFTNLGDHEVSLTITTPAGTYTEKRTITLKKDSAADVGLLNFVYREPDNPTVLLKPWGANIPGGPINNIPVMRMETYWGGFEPLNDQFRDGLTPIPTNPKKIFPLALQLQEMNENIEAGATDQIVLTIRSMSKTAPDFWAFKTPTQASLSYPPKDLQSTYSPDFGYSPTYYQFVRKLMETIVYYGHGNNLRAVVIENEMNSGRSFVGTVNEYCLMAATARKAVKEVLPNVPVYCGGLQGSGTLWVLIDYYLKSSRPAEALEFYYEAYSTDKYYVAGDITRLTQVCASQMALYDKQWTKAILESPLYGYTSGITGLPLDGLNFHNYQPSSCLDRLYRDLFRRYTQLPVSSNEIGIFIPEALVDRDALARYEMVKKLVKMKSLVDDFVSWYSQNGNIEARVHTGGLVDINLFIAENNVATFRNFLEMLGSPETSMANFSDDRPQGVRRYDFAYPGKIVRVVWADGLATFPEPIPPNATVFNIFGEPQTVNNGRLTLPPQVPYYVVWQPPSGTRR